MKFIVRSVRINDRRRKYVTKKKKIRDPVPSAVGDLRFYHTS